MQLYIKELKDIGVNCNNENKNGIRLLNTN